jgi:hypothetical protein
MSLADHADELRREQIRTDIARKTQEMLFEPRKSRIQFAALVVSVFVAGGVIGGVIVTFLNAHQPAPQPIIITLPNEKLGR